MEVKSGGGSEIKAEASPLSKFSSRATVVTTRIPRISALDRNSKHPEIAWLGMTYVNDEFPAKSGGQRAGATPGS